MDEESLPRRRNIDESTTISILIAIGLVVIAAMYLPRVFPRRGISGGVHSSQLLFVHAVDLAMFSYANDNGDAYPTGKSSTEVFQKLIDGGYVTNPAIFYFPMPGKTKALAGAKLKPENVCWDVTIPVDGKDPDSVPLIFVTGYRMIYAPGGNAVPLKPSAITIPGLFVAYKNNSAMFKVDDGLPDHVVRNVIDPSFAPTGKTFQQLTPDGFLPPK